MPHSYEQAAKSGEPMPDGLSWAEQGHFQAIAALTARYLTGKLTPEQSKREKMMIDRQAEDAMSREKYIKHCSDLFRDIEYVAIKYNQERTLEAADEMRDVIYKFIKYTDAERESHEQWLSENNA